MKRRQFLTMLGSAMPILLSPSMLHAFGIDLPGGLSFDTDDVKKVYDSTQKIAAGFEDITPEQEYYIGRSVAAIILSRYKPSNHKASYNYVNVMGQALAQASDRPETFGGYRFMVLDSPEINALSAPGGFIFVTSGLLQCCNTEDAVASVLAHEIGHVQRKHGLQAIQESRITDGVTVLAITGTSTFSGGTLKTLTTTFDDTLTDITTTMIDSGYSRSFEEEADQDAVTIMQRIGYDPNAFIDMLNIMKQRITPSGTGFAKTHPSPEDRIEVVEDIIGCYRQPAACAARNARFPADDRGPVVPCRNSDRKSSAAWLPDSWPRSLRQGSASSACSTNWNRSPTTCASALWPGPARARTTSASYSLTRNHWTGPRRNSASAGRGPARPTSRSSTSVTVREPPPCPLTWSSPSPRCTGSAMTRPWGRPLPATGRSCSRSGFARADGSATDWPGFVPLPKLPTTLPIQPPSAEVATFPIQELAANANAVGNVNASPDADTVYRRLSLLTLFNGQPCPSLPLAAALAGHDPESLHFDNSAIRFLGKNIHADDTGTAILNYRGKGAYRTYGAAAVMESGLLVETGKPPLLALEEFRGKHVLFGFSATGLYDLRPTPMGGVSPGVLVNATGLDNFLSGDFMRRSGSVADMAAVAVFAMLAGLGIMTLQNTALTVAASGMTLAAPVLLSMLLYRLGIWSGVAAPLLGVAVAQFLSGVFRYATEGRQKRFIKSAFKQYLSPHVIEQLLQNPDKLTLGGEKRELTIFFSDLQGFTSISEGLSPEELTSILNEYLTAMTDIIQDAGGTVDKYEGDAIIAFWNAPVDQPDHALRGVTTALNCQRKLAEMRPELFKRTGKEFHMRIGLNTGMAVVGNLGSHTRFDYTMLGDAVNLAARLESINKQFGTYTMISEATLDQLGSAVAVRELSCIRVVGKEKPVRVFEPMEQNEYAQRKKDLSRFAEALAEFYAGRFQEAATLFRNIADRDPAAQRYAAKCAELTDNPPVEWDGVWTMCTK